jgi:hypothetical protein
MPQCDRCGRTISINSDESREWMYLEEGGGEFGFGAELVGAICRDCLTPDEAEGYADDLRRMQERERRSK